MPSWATARSLARLTSPSNFQPPTPNSQLPNRAFGSRELEQGSDWEFQSPAHSCRISGVERSHHEDPGCWPWRHRPSSRRSGSSQRPRRKRRPPRPPTLPRRKMPRRRRRHRGRHGDTPICRARGTTGRSHRSNGRASSVCASATPRKRRRPSRPAPAGGWTARPKRFARASHTPSTRLIRGASLRTATAHR